MSSLSELVLLLMFLLSDEALLEGLSQQVIRLTRHRRLIDQDSAGFNTNSIDRDVHTIDDLDQVSNLEVVSVNNLLFSLSSDSYNLTVKLFAELGEELSLFLVVRDGSDEGYDGHSNENGETFDPSSFLVLLVSEDHLNNDGEEGANKEDLKHEVLERHQDQLAEGSSGRSLLLVVSKGQVPGVEGLDTDTEFSIHLQLVQEFVGAGLVLIGSSNEFLDQVELLNVLSLTIALDDIDKLFLA